jgi:hypothetical protein
MAVGIVPASPICQPLRFEYNSEYSTSIADVGKAR